MVIDDERTGRPRARFAAVPGSAGQARNLVAEALASVPRAVVADAVLLTSELAGNAIEHARTPFSVEVTTAGDSVRIDVTDPRPRRRTPLLASKGITPAG